MLFFWGVGLVLAGGAPDFVVVSMGIASFYLKWSVVRVLTRGAKWGQRASRV